VLEISSIVLLFSIYDRNIIYSFHNLRFIISCRLFFVNEATKKTDELYCFLLMLFESFQKNLVIHISIRIELNSI